MGSFKERPTLIKVSIIVMSTALLSMVARVSLAADVKVGGFASFVAGRAFNSQTTLPEEDPLGNRSRYLADIENSFRDGFSGPELNPDARYFEEWSYLPDSSYGLQFRADLGQGLTATALISARGATGFDTSLDLGYLRYELMDNLTLQVGRQLTPLYYYSDFLDVAYAYHWVRVPTNTYRVSFQTYEGASLTYTQPIQNWDFDFKLFAGSANSDNGVLGDFNFEDLTGLEVKATYDWLEMRLGVVAGEASTEGTFTDKQNPVDAIFASFSTHIDLAPAFVLFEGVHTAVEDDFLEINLGVNQISHVSSFMLSAGYEYQDVTPHITYSFTELALDSNPDRPESLPFEGLSSSTASLTMGVRWDFHPAAALKFEYEINRDESDDLLIDVSGRANEIDLLSIGLDIIF